MANRATPAIHQAPLPPAWLLTTFDSNWDSPITAHNDSSLGQVNGVPVDTGSANNYLVTLPFGVPSSYQQGMTVTFKAVNANTGNSLLTVSPLTAVQLVNIFGNPLVQGDIPAGFTLSCTYNGTAFVVMSPIASNILASSVGNFANARVLFDEHAGPAQGSNFANNLTIPGSLPWLADYSGASAGINYSNLHSDATNKAFGELSGGTGTTTTGFSIAVLSPLWAGLGALEMDYRTLLSAAPNATDNYNFALGAIDASLTFSNFVGVFGTFSASAILSGQCTNASASSNTSTVALPGNAFMRIRILMNAAWNSASFFLNGVQIGSAITTNIPTAKQLFPVIYINKTAGTTQTTWYNDQFYLSYLYNV